MNFEIKIYRHIWKIYAESLNPNNNKIVPLHIFQKSAPAEIHITIFWVNIVPAIAFKFNIVRGWIALCLLSVIVGTDDHGRG